MAVKVVVLGGAGDMGSEAVRDLARNPEVDELVIADYDLDKAQSLAAGLGEKVSAVFADANKRESLVSVFKGADAALNCAGPFYKFERPVAEAALESGVNYVSLCDDYDASKSVLELDDAARLKGVTLLSGVGWTPGLSSVLARKGIDGLDKPMKVNIAWAGGADDSEGLAVIKHTIHIFTGKVPSFQNGELIDIDAGSGREFVRFPSPIGSVPVYHLGHPEPVTMPRFFPQLTEVTLKGGVVPDWLNIFAISVGKAGFTSTADKKDRLANLLKRVMPLIKGKHNFSGIRVDVMGEKDGKLLHQTLSAVDHMNRLTGLPAAVAAAMLANGRINSPGVTAPEICIDPDPFIEELAKRDIRVVYGENFA